LSPNCSHTLWEYVLHMDILLMMSIHVIKYLYINEKRTSPGDQLLPYVFPIGSLKGSLLAGRGSLGLTCKQFCGGELQAQNFGPRVPGPDGPGSKIGLGPNILFSIRCPLLIQISILLFDVHISICPYIHNIHQDLCLVCEHLKIVAKLLTHPTGACLAYGYIAYGVHVCNEIFIY